MHIHTRGLYMGRSQKLCPTFWTWIPKLKLFPIIKTTKQKRQQNAYEGLCDLQVSMSVKKISTLTFDFDL